MPFIVKEETCKDCAVTQIFDSETISFSILPLSFIHMRELVIYMEAKPIFFLFFVEKAFVHISISVCLNIVEFLYSSSLLWYDAIIYIFVHFVTILFNNFKLGWAYEIMFISLISFKCNNCRINLIA